MSQNIRMTVAGKQPVQVGVRGSSPVRIRADTKGGGTSNYSSLYNKPSTEGHELVGDSTIQQIGVGTLSVTEIEKILYLG